MGVDDEEIRVTFNAFDQHSGLNGVYWRLREQGVSGDIDNGYLPLVKYPDSNDCLPPCCTCPHIGECLDLCFDLSIALPINRTQALADYVVRLEVTNEAGLTENK